jgi:hypothetical protein
MSVLQNAGYEAGRLEGANPCFTLHRYNVNDHSDKSVSAGDNT